MSQAWSGDISIDSPAACIKGKALLPNPATHTHTDHFADVQIWAPPNTATPVLLPQNAKLRFLSHVEVARIPLYLAAGPSCDVSTTDEATTRWLTGALLDDGQPDLDGDASRQPWWSRAGMQSEIGILLRVETEDEEEHGIRNVVTEMLLYAAVAKSGPALLTPPTSSSPAPPDCDLNDTLNQWERSINVFALPLCSNIIDLVRSSNEIGPSIPTESRQACFLPYIHDPARGTQPALQKRQSISTLFEDATQKKRKLKGRGGESISQAMAGIDRLPSNHTMLEKQDAPQPQQNTLRRKSLSQTSSMTPVVVGPEQFRSTFGSGPLPSGKRSSLHRVESVNSPRDSPTLSDTDGIYAQQNKAALTKVVMAAMRLHGLQQKNKPPSKSQLPNQATLQTVTNAMANEAEDEYKLVYHQTSKAAIFTFRRHLNTSLISQETMREVVDRLLTMFCTDPMIVGHAASGSEFPELESINALPSSSPFDKPSSQARSSKIANGWNTPTIKKR